MSVSTSKGISAGSSSSVEFQLATSPPVSLSSSARVSQNSRHSSTLNDMGSIGSNGSPGSATDRQQSICILHSSKETTSDGDSFLHAVAQSLQSQSHQQVMVRVCKPLIAEQDSCTKWIVGMIEAYLPWQLSDMISRLIHWLSRQVRLLIFSINLVLESTATREARGENLAANQREDDFILWSRKSFNKNQSDEIQQQYTFDVLVTDSIFIALPLLKLFKANKTVLYMSSEGGHGTKVMTYRDEHESYLLEANTDDGLGRLEQIMRLAYKVCLVIKMILLFLLNLFFILCVGFFANAVLTDCQAMQERLFEVYFLVFSKKVNRHLCRLPCLGKIGKRKYPHKLIRPVNLKQDASLCHLARLKDLGGSLIERSRLSVSLEQKLGFSLRSSLDATEQPKTLVCLQSLTREQDRDFLLKMFAKLTESEDKSDGEQAPVRLIFIDNTQKKLSTVPHQPGSVFSIKDPLNRLERQELLRNASALLCPIHFNGFDISVLEAMHFGCPVVASVTGSAAEFLENGHTGFTLVNDISIWVRQVSQILHPNSNQQPYMDQLGQNIFGEDSQNSINVEVVKQNAREQVQSLFSETLFTESLLMIVNEL